MTLKMRLRTKKMGIKASLIFIPTQKNQRILMDLTEEEKGEAKVLEEEEVKHMGQKEDLHIIVTIQLVNMFNNLVNVSDTRLHVNLLMEVNQTILMDLTEEEKLEAGVPEVEVNHKVQAEDLHIIVTIQIANMFSNLVNVSGTKHLANMQMILDLQLEEETEEVEVQFPKGEVIQETSGASFLQDLAPFLPGKNFL